MSRIGIFETAVRDCAPHAVERVGVYDHQGAYTSACERGLAPPQDPEGARVRIPVEQRAGATLRSAYSNWEVRKACHFPLCISTLVGATVALVPRLP